MITDAPGSSWRALWCDPDIQDRDVAVSDAALLDVCWLAVAAANSHKLTS